MLVSCTRYEHIGKQSSTISTLQPDSTTLLEEKILTVRFNKSEIFFDWDADSDRDRLCKTPYKEPSYRRCYSLW